MCSYVRSMPWVLVAAALLASPSVAQVQAIGPFSGELQEGFETQSTQQTGACVAERIFSDQADLCGWLGSTITISTGLPGGPQPRSGQQMFHTSALVEITFDRPVRRFGGWFTSQWIGGAGTASLFDAGGNLIGAVPFRLTPCAPACTWVWNGWEVHGAGVARILLDSPTGTGGHFELDDLELTSTCDGSPQTYCTPKLNSLGCTPAIAASGSPSATAAAGFVVSAARVRNQHVGLLIYGLSGRAALPFQGGWLCLASPVQRTVPVDSGGSLLPVQDCSGVYALDLNAFAQGLLGGAPRPELRQPGTAVVCQWWGRDSGFAPPLNTALSDALEYSVCP
jgi:hypothetical protein